MPTLGFLKKKRTKDDPADGSPKSPATPTKTGFFHRSRLSSSANHHQHHQPKPQPAASSQDQAQDQPPAQPHDQSLHNADKAKQSQLLPQSGHLNAGLLPSTQSLSPGTTPTTASPFIPVDATQEQSAADSAASAGGAHVEGKQDHRDMNTSSAAGHPTNPAANDTNHASEPPQSHGGAVGDISNSDNPQSALAQQTGPIPSASPGSNPAQQQQEQQQALPNPTNMQSQPQPSQQPQQQPHQAQHQQVQHNGQVKAPQPSHQTSQGGSLPRATKGKYSLADFDILRTLGTGSFGRVHLVQSKHNQRFYAVKVLKKAQVVKMKQVEHTNDERRMLADVKHPFLITLWGTFVDTKNLYMVMDFVEGGELFSLLRKSGRFPNPVAKFYAAEVTLALEYLHSKNIIYRDLKPENLLLDRHGHLKITDFGFAKRVPDKTWTLCGTPDYLAPEVVSNKGYNKSVDWWSLGILIYEMLCGYTPFWDSGSPMKIYENILKGQIKYPAYINADAQNLLERLITADLTKRLGNLYAGSQDVKSHPWFAEVTWERLARKDIDAPYTPPVKAGEGDASQFDRYPEEVEKYGTTMGSDEYGHLFTEF